MSFLAEFPTRELAAGTLFRVHRRANQPAWFNSSGDFRFDPPRLLRGRYGSCYVATEPLAAFVEVFGRGRGIARSELDQRRLSIMNVGGTIRLADLTNRHALGMFGITAACSVGADYQQGQELSGHLASEGFDGILYRVRHDPSLVLEAVALFGDAGEGPERFSNIKTLHVPEDLVDQACIEFGFEILPSLDLPPRPIN